jgi:GAF domain-containing protein
VNITQLLAAMALEVHHLDTPEEAIDRIGQFGRVAVDADDSGILMMVAGKAETTSRTSARVEQAHVSQVELSEGPCLDVIREGAATYRCDDTTTDPRWPIWGPHASKLGYRSVLSVRLATNDRKFGSLNAYSAEAAAFTTQDERTMEFLAAHASVAIAAAHRDRHYVTALDSRTTIGQAQGMIMATFDLDADAAFQFMRRLSQDSNRKLATIALEIVNNRQALHQHISASANDV